MTNSATSMHSLNMMLDISIKRHINCSALVHRFTGSSRSVEGFSELHDNNRMHNIIEDYRQHAICGKEVPQMAAQSFN